MTRYRSLAQHGFRRSPAPCAWLPRHSSRCGVRVSARTSACWTSGFEQAPLDRSAARLAPFSADSGVQPDRSQARSLVPAHQAHDLSAGSDAHRGRGDALRHRGNRGRHHLTHLVPGLACRRRPGTSRQRGEHRCARRLLARLCACITARTTGQSGLAPALGLGKRSGRRDRGRAPAVHLAGSLRPGSSLPGSRRVCSRCSCSPGSPPCARTLVTPTPRFSWAACCRCPPTTATSEPDRA